MALVFNECLTCKARNCSILEGCGIAVLESINHDKKSRKLEKGEVLFSEGDLVAGIYFIKRGFLRIEIKDPNGRPLVLQFAGKGTIFGHVANKDNPYHPRTVTAVTEVQYCFIPLKDFKKIAKKNPALNQHIYSQVLHELKLTERKAFTLAYKSVREKVAEALVLISEFYEYKEKKQSFRISFSREDIADLVGTTKEQISKVLKDFEEEKLIRCTAKKFTFLDLEKLEEISGEISILGLSV